MKKKLIVFLTLCSLFVIGLTQAPAISEASELNFSVESVIPENQRDKSKTYFDLRVEPNSEQTIELKLSNDTDKDVIVEPKVNTATTNINGVVEYGKANVKEDKTLPFNLKDLVTFEKEVTIPANQTITFPVKIKMPEKKFDGILAGGITIQEKDAATDKDKEEDSKSKGMAINNKYAYVVALLLNESDNEVAPVLELDKVSAGQINVRNVINANLHNINPAYTNALKVTGKVTRKGEKEVLYEATKENMQMAPNSNFNFPIALNGKKLEAGTYTLKLDATATEGKWSFTRDFTITADTAKKYNEADVSIKKDNTWIYILIGVILILLSLLLIFFLVRRNKKKKAEEAARKKKAVARKRKRKAQEAEKNKKGSSTK